ncbi:MAG TPA: hypothetical protein VE621_02555 [Bryobacteraceae bacterium]|nr:hypothetical protein [Bryobacteraceae bacterium]
MCLTTLQGDEREDCLRRLEPLAAALSDSQPGAFLGAFEPGMQDFNVLSGHIVALTEQAVVASSVAVLAATKEDCLVDWEMNINARVTHVSQFVRRRDRVRVVYGSKKNKLRSIGPVEFFRPLD